VVEVNGEAAKFDPTTAAPGPGAACVEIASSRFYKVMSLKALTYILIVKCHESFTCGFRAWYRVACLLRDAVRYEEARVF
jgi:hypothetical protein